MKITKLEFKNIFSYGDETTTIEFGNDPKLWQLSGKSGSGKSSLLSIPKLLDNGKSRGCEGSLNDVMVVPFLDCATDPTFLVDPVGDVRDFHWFASASLGLSE